MIMTALITIFGAYLCGSINFAVIFTKAFTRNDVRNLGSGNAGTTNVMRAVGLIPGILTFVCDALKGFVACFVGELIFKFIFEQTAAGWAMPVYGAYVCGLICMIGHIFPLFFEFKGGKGVATSVGIFAVCCPIAIIIGLAGFAISLVVSRVVSISSLIATVIVVILSVIFNDKSALLWPQALLAVIMGAIVFIKHKDNISRLLAGEEKKFTVRRKK